MSVVGGRMTPRKTCTEGAIAIRVIVCCAWFHANRRVGVTAYTMYSRAPVPDISVRPVIEYTGSVADSVTFVADRHLLATDANFWIEPNVAPGMPSTATQTASCVSNTKLHGAKPTGIDRSSANVLCT